MFQIKQIIPQDFCLACQGCCRFLKQKTVWSARLMKREKEKLGCRFNKLRLFAHPQKNICEFFNYRQNKCRIYSRRPFDCRLYPFLLQRKGRRIYLAVETNCPFVQDNQDSPGFQKFIRYLIALLRRPDWRRTLRDNPQVIQKYTRVLSLTELKF